MDGLQAVLLPLRCGSTTKPCTLERPVRNQIRNQWKTRDVQGFENPRNHRRQYEAWSPPTTTWIPENEEDYNQFFEKVRQTVPKDRLFEWDPRRNTMEELCEFMEIRPCPKKGKPGRAINTWIFERDFPVASMAVNTLRLFLHWVNWRLCCAFGRVLTNRCRRQAAHKKPD